MVNKSLKWRRTGNWMGAATVTVFVGALIAIPSRSNNSNNALFNSLLITGLATAIVAEVYHLKSWRLFNNSLRLFNNKANSGKLQPLTLQLQLSPVHAGLALRGRGKMHAFKSMPFAKKIGIGDKRLCPKKYSSRNIVFM